MLPADENEEPFLCRLFFVFRWHVLRYPSSTIHARWLSFLSDFPNVYGISEIVLRDISDLKEMTARFPQHERNVIEVACGLGCGRFDFGF